MTPTTITALLAIALGAAAALSAPQVLEEKFVVNAQFRGGINKSFKDVGRGSVLYKKLDAGGFALSIQGSLKNPDNGELLKMRSTGEFKLDRLSIAKVSQKLEMNEPARRYESLLKENLPFVYLARFQTMPVGKEAEDVTYRYEGRDYRMRYVPLDDSIEATLYQGDLQIGKFFLTGKMGQAPTGLAKARMIGPNHLVFSLVIDTRPSE